MTHSVTAQNSTLTADELDRVSGGIIIVSGRQFNFASVLERVALNPQPLPPKIFSWGHR